MKRRTYSRAPEAPGGEATASRRIALRMVSSSRAPDGATMVHVLEQARDRGEINALDAGLAQEIARGVSRQRRWLEHVLARYLHKPLPKQAAAVQDALLIGLYQALFLERIPSHTIVDETVKLVKSTRTETGYHGLANAIMRRVVREQRADLLPGENEPWLLRYSVPEWLASEAGQVFQNGNARDFFAASNESAPLNLRIVHRPGVPSPEVLAERLRGETVDLTGAVPEIGAGRFLKDCLVVQGRGVSPGHLPSFRQGLVTAEDEGAQIVGLLAGARPGMRILDLCASPGGKASHLADLAERRFARFVATDVDEEKLQRLRETLQRLDLAESIELKLESALDAPEFREAFDLVVVDAPCSSLGTLRRHPEVRWRQKVSNIRALARQQREILDRAASFVAPGGHLLYSVCTFTRQETDLVREHFLSTHGVEFEAAGEPEGMPVDAAGFRDGSGAWRILTHRDRVDTFYVARFRRRGMPQNTDN